MGVDPLTRTEPSPMRHSHPGSFRRHATVPRLPEEFCSAAAGAVGRALDAKADPRWLWKGRRVYLFDGTTVSMPDTPANQAAYPQVYNQGPGLGFPIARVGAITSLACGAIIN